MRVPLYFFSALAMAGLSVPALAAEPEPASQPEPLPEVVERNDAGLATKVKIGDRVYDVCTPENQDSCVNPREVGLDQGNRAIQYWPGKPASEIDEQLPVEGEDAPLPDDGEQTPAGESE